MSMLEQITNEIEVLSAAKADISAALLEKNVSVPNLFIRYGDAVRTIEAGSDEYLSAYVNKSLSAIELSVGLSAIRPCAFKDCKNLRSIAILSSVQTIGENAFLGCDGLISVSFRNKWTGSSNYIGLPFDTNIYGENYDTVNNYAGTVSSTVFNSFDDFGNQWRWHVTDKLMNNLRLQRTTSNDYGNSNFTIGDNLHIYVPDIIEGHLCKRVGLGYFQVDTTNDSYARKLSADLSDKTINISQHLRTFEQAAFYGNTCESVKFLMNYPNDALYNESDFNYSFGNNAFKGIRKMTEFKFPEGKLTCLNAGVFESCTSLKEISIPNTVLKIEGTPFMYCESLQNLVIPDSVLSCYTGAMVYTRCYKLSSVYVGRGIKYTNASYGIPHFQGETLSSLKSITYGCYLSSWSKFGTGAYLVAGLSALQDIYFEDKQSTLDRLSGFSSAHSLNIPSNTKMHMYDCVVSYENKLNAPHTIISALPNNVV